MKRRIILGLVLLTACDAEQTLPSSPAGAVALFPEAAPDCTRSRDNAQAWAVELERVAGARWERVPFSRAEAPAAVMEMAEAESCFQMAGDRTGRLRAQSKRRQFAHEVDRRFARARLNLDVAARLQQPARARQEADELAALLARSEDAAFRQRIERLSHRYAAAAAAARKERK